MPPKRSYMSLRFCSPPTAFAYRVSHPTRPTVTVTQKLASFPAGVEGWLILLVAFYIYFHSGKKLIYPEPVENLPLGIILTARRLNQRTPMNNSALTFAVVRLAFRYPPNAACAAASLATGTRNGLQLT